MKNDTANANVNEAAGQKQAGTKQGAAPATGQKSGRPTPSDSAASGHRWRASARRVKA